MFIDMNLGGDLDLLKALSEETRYRIVKSLLGGEKCACELPGLINRTQSNTSMHLAKLLDAGILKSRRDGKKILYSIKDLRVCDIFKALGNKNGKILKKECCCGGECK
jgi:ArsR family transcriptional regulator